MIYKLKDDVTEEMLVKEGFKPSPTLGGSQIYYLSRGTKRGIIEVNLLTKVFEESVYDRTTYTGFKYNNEHNQSIKRNIQDLISLGYVVEV